MANRPCLVDSPPAAECAWTLPAAATDTGQHMSVGCPLPADTVAVGAGADWYNVCSLLEEKSGCGLNSTLPGDHLSAAAAVSLRARAPFPPPVRPGATLTSGQRVWLTRCRAGGLRADRTTSLLNFCRLPVVGWQSAFLPQGLPTRAPLAGSQQRKRRRWRGIGRKGRGSGEQLRQQRRRRQSRGVQSASDCRSERGPVAR